MLDSTDGERLEEAKKELTGLLSEPELNGVPVVVLANKQDLTKAIPIPDLAKKLELPDDVCKIFPCSAKQG